ncbi:MAG: hypothetical protein ACREI1_12885, partial [Nitrospiraceae bacterium]
RDRSMEKQDQDRVGIALLPRFRASRLDDHPIREDPRLRTRTMTLNAVNLAPTLRLIDILSSIAAPYFCESR